MADCFNYPPKDKKIEIQEKEKNKSHLSYETSVQGGSEFLQGKWLIIFCNTEYFWQHVFYAIVKTTLYE